MFYSNYEKEGSRIIFDEMVKICTVQSSNRLFQLSEELVAYIYSEVVQQQK